MSFLSLELSDVGILAAGNLPPRLLAVDGSETESPGFALPQKEGLVVGQSAERQARLHPQRVQHSFWDQLSTDPLKTPRHFSETHVEMAFAHLTQIWEKIKQHGSEVIIAVPAFYSRHQLGLLLGITQELSIPIKGLVIQAVVAVPKPFPGSRLVYLDVHLHRTEVTVLEQGDQLRLQETATLDELGLVHLYRIWAETMAEAFVRTTRFDPLHEAASEQALYDRIPEILNRQSKDPTETIDLRTGATVHRVTLNQDLLIRKTANFIEQVRVLVRSLMEKTGRAQGNVTILMSHRFARLPGAATLRSGFDQARLVELEAGASALNTLQVWDQFDHQTDDDDAAFFTSRPWQPFSADGLLQSEPMKSTGGYPTHLLHCDLAYPITEAPLSIGQKDNTAGGGLLIGSQSLEDTRPHCSVRRTGDQIVLTAIEGRDIFIDNQPLEGESMVLHLGQSVRVGKTGELIRLIACLKADET
jgi:hypothetical protein